MRPVVLAFLLAEAMDGLTTYAGLRLGMKELNPLDWRLLVPLKILVVIAVALVLQVRRPYKAYWIVPAVAGLIAIWNVLNIVLYYI